MCTIYRPRPIAAICFTRFFPSMNRANLARDTDYVQRSISNNIVSYFCDMLYNALQASLKEFLYVNPFNER